MRKSGFTLAEMLVAIAVMAIVLTIGVPNFNSIIRSSDMVANSSDMVAAFNYARMEAVKRGALVELDQRDGSTWTGGMVAWVDTDNDTTLDAGEELRVWDALNSGSSVSSGGSISSFIFNSSGEVNNADVLTLCDDRSGEVGRTISILVSGAIFAEKVNCG